jgi:hypothetical protein
MAGLIAVGDPPVEFDDKTDAISDVVKDPSAQARVRDLALALRQVVRSFDITEISQLE